MGFYSETIFPQLLDWVMDTPLFAAYRQEVLAEVQGDVLEIGFGTGLNLMHYPSQVRRLTTIDVNPGMARKAASRLQASPIAVEFQVLNGESLPMADGSFDCVVSTWTLCSIARVEQALAEVYRVLRPGGQFFFIEHGLSDRPSVQVWQHRLTPLQKRLGDGCHLDRNIQALVEQQFDQVRVDRFVPPNLPEWSAYMYKGVATKQAPDAGE